MHALSKAGTSKIQFGSRNGVKADNVGHHWGACVCARAMRSMYKCARSLPHTNYRARYSWTIVLCKCASNMPFRSPCIPLKSRCHPLRNHPDWEIDCYWTASVTDKLFADWVNRIYRMLHRYQRYLSRFRWLNLTYFFLAETLCEF